MPSFSKQQQIGAYKVVFPIKDAAYAETYRVKDSTGTNYFLKLFNYAKLHRTQFDDAGNVLELEISKLLKHPNLTAYKDSGEILLNGQIMAYIVYDFISGETVAQKVMRDQRCSVYDAKQIVLGTLNGVKFLHSLPTPVIHNELTIENVMLDMSGGNMIPRIIDFGHARFLTQGNKSFHKDGLNPFYMAPESFNGIFTLQTDLYSVGVMLYHILFDLPPHFIDISPYKNDMSNVEEVILSERNKPLRIPDTGRQDIDENLINIIAKALAPNVDDRFQSADEFIKALSGDVKVVPVARTTVGITEKSKPAKVNRKTGKGFADVVEWMN